MPPHSGPPPGPPGAAPKKPSRRTAWIIGGVVVALFAMFWVIGTVSKSDEEPAATSTTSSSSSTATPMTTVAVAPPPATGAPTIEAAKVAACYRPSPIADPELAAFAAGLSLPPGVQVITGRVSTQSTKPGQVGVALDLCVPGSTDADSLRPIATSIAAALKPTALGGRTFALYVADMSAEFKDEAKLKDGDYALHLWNGKPSAAAENARWEVTGR